MTNFAKIGDAQKSQLTMRLDSAAAGTQTVAGTSTSVDPRNYMTSLEKAQVSGAEIPVEVCQCLRTKLELYVLILSQDLNRARQVPFSPYVTNM
jgi:pre-mRNA-processing factor 6